MQKLLFLLLSSATYQLSFTQNVGIGTSTPNAKIHIKGSEDTSQLVIDAHTSQTTPLIRLRSSQGEDKLHIYADTLYNAFYGINAGMSNRLPQGLYNTFIGSNAGALNTRGRFNTVLGRAAFYNNRLGSDNTAIGYHSLFFNTAEDNTAVGSEALYGNTTGEENVGIGKWALRTNSTGHDNTAAGTYALQNNTTGSYNSASGSGALGDNTTGDANTAVGYSALSNNTVASFNTAMGYYALRENTNAAYANTAVGSQALRNNTTGSSNTAVGDSALLNNTTGNYNVALGKNSGIHPGSPNISNTVSVGNHGWYNAASNQVFLGNGSTSWIGGWKNWSVYSDGRMKTNITEEVKGLEFIERLRPVTYFISLKTATTLTGNKETPDYPEKYDSEKIKQSGFIAQEVEKAAQESGYDFDGVRKPRNEHDLYSMSYSSLVVPLVKAVQEQQTIIEQQQQKIQLLEKRLSKLETAEK